MFFLGTIHAIYIEESFVFGEKDLLISQIINQFLHVHGQTKLDLSKSNYSKSMDFFQILENFMLESLGLPTPDFTRAKLYNHQPALKNYFQLTSSVKSSNRD